MSNAEADAAQRFLKDIGAHELKIVRESGVYRHIYCGKPNDGNMSFHIHTYPGGLLYTGDMGTYVFSRLNDMFDFFRRSDSPTAPISINAPYWSEKLTAVDCDGPNRSGSATEFSESQFIAALHRWMDGDSRVTPSVREAVQDEIIDGRNGRSAEEAYRVVSQFEHDGFKFEEFWEADLTDYTFRFLWCCFAIVWAIRQYDAEKLGLSAKAVA